LIIVPIVLVGSLAVPTGPSKATTTRAVVTGRIGSVG
jgi:hypothetical protein